MSKTLKIENLVSPNKVVGLLGDALFIVDKKERIVFANRAASKFFEMPKTKLIGRKIDSFHTKKAKKIVKEEIRTKRRKGKTTTYHIHIKTAKGKIIPVLVTGSPIIKNGKFFGSIGVYTDISKREKISQELKESKEFLEKIVNCMGEGLIAIGKDQKLFFVNDRFAEMLGYTKEKLLGKHWHFWFPPDQYELIRQRALEKRKKWQNSTYESEYLAKNGDRIPTRTTGTPLGKKGEKYQGSIGVISDITEQKEAERRLKKSYKALEKVLSDNIDFINQASHELRTPLTIIMGIADVLSWQKKVTKNDLAEALKSIQQESKRMSKIIEELLVLARVKQGRQKIKFTRSRLDTLVNSEIRKLKPLQEERKIEINKMPIVTISMDREKIGYVIRNLVENAIKFTDPEKGIIKISLKKSKNNVSLSIDDNGIGITKKEINNIFDRFYRGQKAKKGQSGSGLGLFICKWIIDAHAGTISVARKSKKGSLFRFTLPKNSY